MQPGTDVMLFNGLLHIMLWEGWTNGRLHRRAHHRLRCAQGAGARMHARPVAQVCGMRKEDLFTAARWFATSAAHAQPVLPGPEPVQQRHGQERGADQPAPGHGADRQAGRGAVLAHRPAQRHGRARSRRPGQPAVGAPRPGQSAAPRRSGRAVGRAGVPEKPGKTAVEMFQAAADGEIKALWIACTNPAQSMPDQATVRRALERAEFVVVQEAFATTATCDYADLLLPATTWGEKDGTVTNSERRISRVRPAVPAPGEARHDWAIAVDFARRLERKLRPADAAHPVSLRTTPEAAIWNEHRESTRGRDLDITGLSYALLEDAPAAMALPGRRDRKAKPACTKTACSPPPTAGPASSPRAYKPLAEPRESRYPVLPHHRAPARPVARHEPHRHAGAAVRPRRRTGGAAAPAGHGAPPAQGGRPGARHLASAARSWCPCRRARTWA